MSNCSKNSQYQIIFQSETFPIVGLADEELKRSILEERRVSAADCWETRTNAIIRYIDPYPWTDKGPQEKEFHLSDKIIISRDNAQIILEVQGTIEEVDQVTGMPKILGTQVVASEKISIGPLLRILKDYVGQHSNIQGLVSAFSGSADLGKVISGDEMRKALHSYVSMAIEKQLEGKSIEFGRVSGDEYFPAWRYFSTALMMHILPAAIFRDMDFLKDEVRPKYESRHRTWDAKNNPFRDRTAAPA